MSETIHILNKRKGGVWEIIKRLEKTGDESSTISFSTFMKLLKNNYSKIFFHQPKSHLFALILIPFIKRDKIVCVLHESANYNTYWSFKSISILISRYLVIYILKFVKIKMLSVSNYVSSSYFLKHTPNISYLYLFKNEMIELIDDLSKKRENNALNGCVAWIRKGTAIWTYNLIYLLHRKKLINQVILLGDEKEINILKALIQENIKSINLNTPLLLSKKKFYETLWENKWFISGFPKEGFGLSVFEAACLGSICLTPKSGALLEWLPNENFEIMSKILKNELNHQELPNVVLLNKELINKL